MRPSRIVSGTHTQEKSMFASKIARSATLSLAVAAVISSIAGTKGLGAAPAYSATKRFQNTYIDALEQLAHIQKLPIRFTDIRPGFVATGLLNDGKHYPMLMHTEKVARHIVCALEKKKRIVVIDWRYRILVALWRLIPPFLWKRLPVRN
jgi:short-subunit dehydrogenase